ncbi:hypothetical protein B0H12DRAFT_1069610 [Mycena haematopus]|nr:hypothetical protein B0H12DRAFT_1069610 [Mycena haematopus]
MQHVSLQCVGTLSTGKMRRKKNHYLYLGTGLLNIYFVRDEPHINLLALKMEVHPFEMSAKKTAVTCDPAALARRTGHELYSCCSIQTCVQLAPRLPRVPVWSVSSHNQPITVFVYDHRIQLEAPTICTYVAVTNVLDDANIPVFNGSALRDKPHGSKPRRQFRIRSVCNLIDGKPREKIRSSAMILKEAIWRSESA